MRASAIYDKYIIVTDKQFLKSKVFWCCHRLSVSRRCQCSSRINALNIHIELHGKYNSSARNATPAKDSTMILSTIFLILFPIYTVGCYILLFSKRKELFFLKRNESAIIVASLAGWLAYFTLAASSSNSIPCGVIYVASSLIAPFATAPQLSRAFLLRGKFEASKLVIEEEISFREQKKGRGLSTIQSGSEYKSGDGNKSTAPSNLVSLSQEKKQSDLAMERAHNAVSTIKWALSILIPILLVLAWSLSSIEAENPMLSTVYNDCQAVPAYISYAKLLTDIVSLVMAIMACAFVRSIDDELFLHLEISETAVLFIITSIIVVPVRLAGHTEVQPLLQTIQQMVLLCSMILVPCCPEVKAIKNVRSWFKHRIIPASKSAVPGYAQPLPQHRGSTARSSMHLTAKEENKRLTLETNTSWDAGLCILLSSQEGINAFTRHCAREFSSENILFWCAVNDYIEKFDDNRITGRTTTIGDDVEHNTEEANKSEQYEVSIVDEARDIYDRFIDNHSNNQVNLSSKQKSDIKAAIDSGELTKDTFEVAKREIFSVMSRDSYPRFLASKKNRRAI